MELARAPIGIYDSGVGGLTVWLALKKLLNQDLIYYADTAHIPYGDKSKEQILFYSHSIVNFLKQQQARIIVAACNTSSALALPTLQLSASIPLFGVIEPAVKKAAAATKNNRVGLIATVGTVNSSSYQKEFHKLAPDVALFAQKAPKLVPLIEAGKLDGPEVSSALHQYLDPLLRQEIDTLILGCTHYPFLLEPIRAIVGPDINIIDPAWQLAEDVRDWLRDHGYADKGQPAKEVFWTSGNPQEFQKKASFFIGQQIKAVNFHRPAEELPSVMEAFLGELSPVWRGEKDQ